MRLLYLLGSLILAATVEIIITGTSALTVYIALTNYVDAKRALWATIPFALLAYFYIRYNHKLQAKQDEMMQKLLKNEK